jgi:hypothetical protein
MSDWYAEVIIIDLVRKYLDGYKGICSVIEFPVPKLMCKNRNYLILISTLKQTKGH